MPEPRGPCAPRAGVRGVGHPQAPCALPQVEAWAAGALKAVPSQLYPLVADGWPGGTLGGLEGLASVTLALATGSADSGAPWGGPPAASLKVLGLV